jgi:hypothetical protein
VLTHGFSPMSNLRIGPMGSEHFDSSKGRTIVKRVVGFVFACLGIVLGLAGATPAHAQTNFHSFVSENGTGLSAAGGGTIFSYGNNRLTGNVSDGVTPMTSGFALK